MKKYIIAGILVIAVIACALYLIFVNKNPAPTAVTPSGAPSSTPNTVEPTSLPTTTLPVDNPPA
jgi:hypothetical protein